MLKFDLEETPDTKLEKLRRALSGYRFPQADTWPLFAALLSLPHPEGHPSLSLSPQKQKEKTHEALVAWLCEEANQQAMTYAWEDLHWADPSTLELLALFLNQVPTTQLLAVLTFRPEFTPLWGSHSYLSQLTLSRLGQTHAEMMVEKVTGDKVLPREVVRQIASKTDGVPLFVEELTKMVVEQNVGAYCNTPLPWHSCHVAGCTDGPAGSTRNGQRDRATRCYTRDANSLMSCSMPSHRCTKRRYNRVSSS